MSHTTTLRYRIGLSLLVLATGCSSNEQASAPKPNPKAAAPDSAAQPPTEATLEPATEPSEAATESTADVPSDPVVLRDLAIESLDSGELDIAFDLARRAKRADPENPETIFLHARVLAARNRFAEAIQILDDLAEDVPDARLPVLGQTAEWLVIQGDWGEAESRYQRLLREVGDGGLVSRRLAELYLRQGRRDEAAEQLRTLCRQGNVEEVELRALLSITSPFAGEDTEDERETIGALGRSRSLIAEGDWDSARQEIESVESPGEAESALRARIYAATNEYDLLDAWLEGNASISGADGWFAKGSLAAHQSDDQQAVRAFCQAVQEDATDAESYRRLSQSLESLGETDIAKVAASRADMIRQTHEIGLRMANSDVPSSTDITELSQLLDQLRRPYEALAWRAVGTVYASSRTEITREEAVERLERINRERLQIKPPGADERQRFLQCGIDLDLSSNKADESGLK